MESYTYSGYTDVKFHRVELGLVSNSLYYYGTLSTPNDYTTIRKVDSTEIQIWEIVIPYEPAKNAFVITEDEQYIYFSLQPSSAIVLVQISTVDGTILNSVSTQTYSNSPTSSIAVSNVNNVVFFSTSFSSNAYICKWCPNTVGRD